MTKTANARADAGPIGRDAYRLFLDHADRLVRPLIALMEPGQSSLPLEARESNHGSDADRLEAFARPLLLLALWLRGRRTLGLTDADDAKVIAWAEEAMCTGADPASPGYWGTLTNYHQHAVEMAIFTMALDAASDELWTGLQPGTRALVLDFFSQIRGHGGHRNNHLFFDVLTLEFLNANGAGELGDDAAIEHHLDELECMHRKDGWFIDGGNESYDHYNAYAFHIYGLWWAHRYGARNPERAERWVRLAADFLPAYAHMYAASGEPIPIGRSLTYRFNGVGVFPLSALHGIDTIDLGMGRRLCRKCIDFFASKPIEQSQGCLSLGWTDHFERMTEGYSCAGSPYWAAKGLLMLILPPEHAFFAVEEQPTPAETGEQVMVSAPGWVIRHRYGESAVINAGGSSSMNVLNRMGAWKWGKLVYHTGVDGLVCAGPDGDPGDASLTARPADGDAFVGRHNTMPIKVADDHIVCQYQLGMPYERMNVAVRTHLWWLDDWYVTLHVGIARQRTVLRAGGFAVPNPSSHGSSGIASSVEGLEWSTRIMPIAGFESSGVATQDERAHAAAQAHAMPFLRTPVLTGRFRIACAWSLSQAQSKCEPLEVVASSTRAVRVRVGTTERELASEDWTYPSE
ncbi:MAG: DUF2264 domain-containing protein [Pseudomonadota bacterium]